MQWRHIHFAALALMALGWLGGRWGHDLEFWGMAAGLLVALLMMRGRAAIVIDEGGIAGIWRPRWLRRTLVVWSAYWDEVIRLREEVWFDWAKTDFGKRALVLETEAAKKWFVFGFEFEDQRCYLRFVDEIVRRAELGECQEAANTRSRGASGTSYSRRQGARR